MANFQYAATSIAGEQLTGLASALNELDLDRMLESRGLTLTRARLLKRGELRSGHKLKGSELVYFTTQLATMLGAGVPVLQGLRGIGKRMRSASGRQVVLDLVAGLEGGMSLSQVMAMHPASYPDVYRACVEAGEISGSLPKVLDRIAGYISWSRAMRATTLQAMLYPAILFVAIIVLVIVLLTFLLPRIVGLFPGGEEQLPRETRAVMAISDFLIGNGPFLLVGLVAGVAAFIVGLRKPAFREKASYLLLCVPRFGEVVRMLATSRFASTASTLQGAGVEVSAVLTTSGRTCGNSYMAAAFTRVAERVRGGHTITESMEAEPKLDPLLVQMAHVGESSGDLAAAFERLSLYYDEEVPRTVKWFLALLEPLMLVCAGVIVAMILLAAMMPILSLYENIS